MINYNPTQNPTRFLFFTGKGGVGKTSLSCSTALALADRGKATLLVSTDPASNLGQVLETVIGSEPTPIQKAKNLWALNIDPRKSAAEYRERIVGPYRGILPDAAVVEIEEQLSGACTVEIAAFDEFSKLMTNEEAYSKYDHIIFDTAPTGHTLRLLTLSAAWKDYLKSTSGNASCLGPLSGLKGQQKQFELTLQTLIDSTKTTLILVTRPEKHSIAEANRTCKELKALGVHNQELVINGILGTGDIDDEVALAMRQQEINAIENLPFDLKRLTISEVPLSAIPPIGITSLRLILNSSTSSNSTFSTSQPTYENNLENFPDLSELINGLELKSGIFMTMGKGGVGKTTLATILAIQMAERGAKVHLTTSDPAAHLDFSLANRYPNLRVSRIDPRVETEAYQNEVIKQSSSQLDTDALRLLEEDLRSPCTEEIAVFRAFSRVVEEAKDSIVILDTAPTGHTLLLLDATEAYHREVSRNRSSMPEEVKQLLPRLRDPNYTKVMIVTLPEATPVQEALDLHNDLKRAKITPYAWIINQSLSPLNVLHPVLRVRRNNEWAHIQKVQGIATKLALVPWQATETILQKSY